MKEQQTYPIEWEKNRVAYCNNNFIGMVIYELTYWFAKNIHGDPH